MPIVDGHPPEGRFPNSVATTARVEARWGRLLAREYARLQRYGFALLMLVLGMALLTIPVVRDGAGTPAIIIFFIILLSAWYGGMGPGLMITAVIALLTSGTSYPLWRVVRLALFIASSVLICTLAETLHAARRRAEESRRWLSAVLASIGDAVIATDRRGHVCFLNPAAESLTGWGAAGAIGRPLEEVFPILDERTRRPVEDPVRKVMREGIVVGLPNHTMLIARDGGETPIDDSAAPIIDDRGEVAGVVLVFRDVTERRRAEEQRERLAAIVESSDDLIVSKTLDGVITSWNRGAERFLGYTADEVVGRHVSMLMPPELVEDMPKILDRVRRGETVDHYETRRTRKDGTAVDVSLTVFPIRDASGRIIGASKMGRDITREKLIEGERREADRRKDEFLAMLAHELRNPLAAIGNAAQLLGKLVPEEGLEWARDVVQRQVKHLARLIDDLLDVSRISQGKIGLRKEPLDLSPIVASAVEAVRPLLEERKHELSVSLADGGLRLEADPMRIEQILVNLLTNAAKYTDAGGRISLTSRRQGADLVIKVRDTGVGITPELLPRIFDLFAQGDRTIARSEGGLGIGLTLVQKLAAMHGGGVTAASEGPGEGSEFTVRLPALESPADRKPSPGETSPRRPSGLPRTRRGRQHRHRRGARPAHEAARARRPGLPRRPGRHRGRPCPPARDRAPGHRPARHGRLRGRQAAPGGGERQGRSHHRGVRVRTARRPPPLARVGLRPSPGQAGRLRRPDGPAGLPAGLDVRLVNPPPVV